MRNPQTFILRLAQYRRVFEADLRMDEREHTKAELAKMEKVRRYLLDENIVDDEGFIEFVNTL